jgi:hypothetical protein
MMNLFEIMQAAQGGRAVGNLSSQFGISPQQTQSALEALLPAFSMGLRNKTQSPDMFSQLAGMMTGAQAGQQAYEDANGDGIPDHLQQEGNQVLGQLFGSKEMSRALADQASMASGVSSAVLKAMLPVVASMIMGGLFKSASNQGLGGILGQLAQGMGGQQGGGFGQNQASSNPIGDLIGSMMGGGQAQPQSGGGQAQPQSGGGMGDMLGGLMGAMMGGTQGQPQPQPQTRQAGFDPAAMGLEALTGMFNTGRQVQEQHQTNLQTIFDAFLKR